MPGKSKKGGGLESYSPYKMKGSPMKRNFGVKPSPFKEPLVTAAIVGAVASAALRPKSKAGSPGLTNPGDELAQMKIGTGQETGNLATSGKKA